MNIKLTKPDTVAYIFAEKTENNLTPNEKDMLNVYRSYLEQIVEHPYGYHLETHRLVINNMSNSLEYAVMWNHLYKTAPYLFDVINYETVKEESIFRGMVSDSFLTHYWEALNSYSQEQAAAYAYEQTLNEYGVLFNQVVKKFPSFVEDLQETFGDSLESF